MTDAEFDASLHAIRNQLAHPLPVGTDSAPSTKETKP